MKLSRILAVPVALVADVLTLGNMGNRSFTEQVFDAERQDQRHQQELEAVRALADLLRDLK